jgi:excisionase family DNA binding protein
MSLKQVTVYSSMSNRTIRTWIHSPTDSLPAVQVRGKILVRRSELDVWLERHRVRPLAAVDLNAIVKDVLGKSNGR